MSAAAGVVVASGLLVLVGALFAPTDTERIYGHARAAIVTTQTALSGELPSVTLGIPGGIDELDRCDGTFIEMVDYRRDDVPRTGAAHNNCGGDVILPWEIGQEFLVDGEEYVVVEIRTLPKRVGTTDDLVGLRGDLALQTCFYGQQLMKVIGAEKSVK